MGYPQYAQPYPQPGYPQPGAPMAPQGMSAPMAPQSMPPNIPGGYPTTVQAPAAPRQLGDPSGGGGQGGPQPRHLIGRTVIIEPLSINDGNEYKGVRRPTLTCNLIVVDGGPVQYGDNQDNGQPNTMQCQTPAHFKRVFLNSSSIVEGCRPLLPIGGNPGGVSVGVIERGTKNSNAFLLTKLDKDVNGNDRPNAAQLRAAANAVWQAVESGQFQNPVPTPLAPPTAGAAYGAPQQYAPAYAPAPYQPQYAATPGYMQPQAPMPQYPPQMPAQYPPQPQSAPPAPDPNAPPPGWAPEQWNTLSAEQRAGIMAQQGAQATPSHPGI